MIYHIITMQVAEQKEVAIEKRCLTAAEIGDMVSIIPLNTRIPRETAESIRNQLVKNLTSQLARVKIYPSLIPALAKKIEDDYRRSRAQPGTSVGVLAAQSIGEKSTQATLNSVDWTDKIIYENNGRVVIEPIGQMIDRLLEEHEGNVKVMENKTEYLAVEPGMTIPSCDEDGNLEWLKIEAVTRHPPGGKLVKVKTQSGREVIASQAKSFLTWNGEKFVDTLGSVLKVGDILPSTSSLPRPSVSDISDLLSNDWYEMGSHFKEEVIPGYVFAADNVYLKNFITGYFTGAFSVDDGCVYTDTHSDDFMKGMSILLSYFGIFCEFDTTDGYVLVIRDKYATKFANTFFPHFYMVEAFQPNNWYDEGQGKFPKDRDVYFDRVVSIELVDATNGVVYDFTVEKTRNFMLFNGLNVRDTFHKAGSSGNVGGASSSFSDMINATKNPRKTTMQVRFNGDNSTIHELVEMIGSRIVEITLADIVKEIHVCVDKEEEKWYEAFRFLYNDDYTKYTDCLRLVIDMDKLYTFNLALCDLVSIFGEYEDMTCVISPDCIGEIHVFADTTNIRMDEQRLAFVTPENAREIYLDEVVYNNIKENRICGVPGIKEMFFLKDDNEWLIETTGCNFMEMVGIENVDQTTLSSSNIWEIYDCLGIEAVREFMIKQFKNLMVSLRNAHVTILVDRMTNNGTINSISRYTMRGEEDTLSRATFEESNLVLSVAAQSGSHEHLKGVSASIICGKRANMGTGLSKVVPDITGNGEISNISLDDL